MRASAMANNLYHPVAVPTTEDREKRANTLAGGALGAAGGALGALSLGREEDEEGNSRYRLSPLLGALAGGGLGAVGGYLSNRLFNQQAAPSVLPSDQFRQQMVSRAVNPSGAGVVRPPLALPGTAKVSSRVDAAGPDMDSLAGRIADYLDITNTWSSERAGRAKTVARAAGEDPGDLVSYPKTLGSVAGLGGALVGGGLGALAGGGLGFGGSLLYSILSGRPATTFDDHTRAAAIPAAIGLGLGAVGGGVSGPLLAASARRDDMRRIMDKARRAEAAGKLKPLAPELPTGMLGVLTAPGGSHRLGQVDAYEALLGKKPSRTELRDVANLATLPAPFALSAAAAATETPLGLLGPYVQGLPAHLLAASRLRKLQKRRRGR